MSVANHRHCQATILGATGLPSGTGHTWNTISGLPISNLGDDWLDNFRENQNITEDLAAILRLINTVASRIVSLNEGNLISILSDGQTIGVRNNISSEYTGLIGVSGTGSNRQLVEQDIRVINENEQGPIIAKLVVDDVEYPIRALNDGNSGGGDDPTPQSSN